jgi:N-methylhydantoinase A
VLTILNSNMANAIRAKTVQKGLDPRDFALVAFGGAGPLHGAEVAAVLNIPEVVVPPHPGITSAAGLLTTDIKYDQIKTEFQTKGGVDLGKLREDFAGLEAALAAQFEKDGIARAAVGLQRFGDLRYVGQGYELRVPFPAGGLDHAALEGVWNAFHEQHRREYGHFFAESPIEIVNIRVTGIGATPKIGKPVPAAGASVAAALVRRGQSVFRVEGVLGSYDTAYYRRELLPLGKPVAGPAIILQRDTTTVVPPGWSAEADQGGNLILRAQPKG